MSTLTSNLYPPIVHDTQPAFIRTGDCKLYFRLSEYDKESDIENIQISLIKQATNQSALSQAFWPSGIMWRNKEEWYKDSPDSDWYYILITQNTYTASDIEEQAFGINQYYVAQMRFTSTDAAPVPAKGKGLDTWLYDNRDYFSEWSTSCIIRGIAQPHITINGLDDTQTQTFTTAPDKIVGKLYYEQQDEAETENLYSYKFKIINTATSEVLEESPILFPTDKNRRQFNTYLKCEFKPHIIYDIQFSYTTINSYSETLDFRFQATTDPQVLEARFSVTPDGENGRMNLSLLFGEYPPDRELIVRRSSSKNNFKDWEIIKRFEHSHYDFRHLWYDTSIESGIWYKYKVRTTDNRSIVSEIESQPRMCVFENAFLTTGDRQLKIQFNPTVSNYKYNVTETQQVTLGSQFPFVKKNGNNYFRTFTLGGLITAYMDETFWYNPQYYDNSFHNDELDEQFTSKEEIYGESAPLYDEYNSKRNITLANDYIYQREFREKVIEFLYKNDLKIFRSITEGNIIVKLMDINFTPNDTLGRRLYSFTATAVEINNATLQNYLNYKLINKQFYAFRTQIINLNRPGNINNVTYTSGVSLIPVFISKMTKRDNDTLSKFMSVEITSRESTNAIRFAYKTNDTSDYVIQDIEAGGNFSVPIQDKNSLIDCLFYGEVPTAVTYDTSRIYSEDENGQLFYYDEEQETEVILVPTANTVYTVYTDNTSYLIDRYDKYEGNNDLLKTYPDELDPEYTDEGDDTPHSLFNNGRIYSLLVEGYIKQYFYQQSAPGQPGVYVPFKDGCLLYDVQATVEYTYRLKRGT